IAAATTHVLDVELLSPSLRQFLCEQARDRICRTARRVGNDHAHGSVGIALCPCTRHDRPRCDRTSEQRDELDALHPGDHSCNSSASCRNVSGIVSQSAFAVLRLTTSSNLLASCTGKSPGFAPFRMRSTYEAACRYKYGKSIRRSAPANRHAENRSQAGPP